MRRTRFTRAVTELLMVAALLAVVPAIAAAQGAAKADVRKTTGFDIKKPVVGAACPGCPWGSMAEVVREAIKPYGWDIQICYYCAGSAREVRLVMKQAMATPPENPGPNDLPTPKGPIDFGIAGLEFVKWAYDGIHDFARDPGKPDKDLRLIANIQEINYYFVAVKADSGIGNLSEIVEKKLPVKMVVRMGIGGDFTPAVMQYYGITADKIKSFGGTFDTGYDRVRDSDVFVGFGSLVNAPEYNVWYQASQKYDLKFLELAPGLREKLKKEFFVQDGTIPYNALRGVDRRIPTVIRNGTLIYGKSSMPDEFAYTMAKAIDEHQELLGMANSSMNWAYNWRQVWKALDIPLHPGAAKYYKEVGYMK